MRPKALMLLILALGCGLVASLSINQVLAKRRLAHQDVAETKSILVAMSDIEMGSPLTAQVVKLEDWPKDKVPPGVVNDLTKVENRRTRTKIYAGEPILEFKLLSEGAGDGATALIPKGLRAISVKVDDVSGGASLILPGDRVDVLVSLRENPQHGVPEATTRTILQDVRVFAVNEIFERAPRDPSEASITAKTISLLVSPDQAEIVTLAAHMGEIRLVMRSREDQGESKTDGAVGHQLLGETSVADRNQDSLVDEKHAPNDLLSMLGKPPVPATTTVEPAQPATEVAAGGPAKKSFRMVLIEGSNRREIEFEGGRIIETGSIGGDGVDAAAQPSETTSEPEDATSPAEDEHEAPAEEAEAEPAENTSSAT